MDTTLGQRIRARRQRAQWKLKDLAEKTGLSIPYLSDLERDQGNPTVDTLRAIASALDCDVTDLLGETKSGPGRDIALSISLQRFLDSEDFAARLKQLAGRLGRPVDDELRIEAVNFLASAPKRSAGELTKSDWNQLLDFYSLIATR